MSCDFEKLKRVIAAIDENILVYVDGYLCNVHEDRDAIFFINVVDDDPNMDIPDSALYITPKSDCAIKLHWLNGKVMSIDVDEHDGCVPRHITFAKAILGHGLTVSELEPELTFRCPKCGSNRFSSTFVKKFARNDSVSVSEGGSLYISDNEASPEVVDPALLFTGYICGNKRCCAEWNSLDEMVHDGCFPEYNKAQDNGNR